MSEAKQKEQDEDKFVIEKKYKVRVKEAINKLFLIGWHDNHGTFELSDGTWSIEIAGGCQGVVVTRPDKRKFYFSISELLSEMIDDIKNVK